MKKQISILLIIMAFWGFPQKAIADSFSLSQEEQEKILAEADDWIDDMPVGLQDRLSDALLHAQHGFYSELEMLRKLSVNSDTVHYEVEVIDFKGGEKDDINMRLYKAQDTNTNTEKNLLIYFHGGGWSLGSVNTSDRFCRALASLGNIDIVSVEYPLAPENPYPSGLNVCLDVVKFLSGHAEKSGKTYDKVSLGGDGAGGNLALAVYQNLPDSICIKDIILYYPMIQSNGILDKASKKEYGRGYGFDSRVREAFISSYDGMPEKETRTYPPILLISAGRDIIIQEQRNFAKQYPQTEYIEFSGAVHGFLSDGRQYAAFTKAVELTDLFLKSHLLR